MHPQMLRAHPLPNLAFSYPYISQEAQYCAKDGQQLKFNFFQPLLPSLCQNYQAVCHIQYINYMTQLGLASQPPQPSHSGELLSLLRYIINIALI